MTILFLELLPALQARGRPHEAEGEVRALLDLVRKSRAVLGISLAMKESCERMLGPATGASVSIRDLILLDPELGDQELLKSVAVELAALQACGDPQLREEQYNQTVAAEVAHLRRSV